MADNDNDRECIPSREDYPARCYEAALANRGYTVSSVLGEGSYAKVKKAYSQRNKRQVALKIINQLLAPSDFQNKFLPRELEIHKKVKHPCIIQVLDMFRIGHKYYIAMELAGHGDLLDFVRLRGAIKESLSRIMFRQLADAVAYLHARMILHRDLKCENILLDQFNNVKLGDFGFSRWMEPGVDHSQTYCGSAAYAAPEILKGIPYTGFGYDIWSLGVILFILVCGSMPYDDRHLSKMIKLQISHSVHFPSRIVNLISYEVRNLILQMLHPDVDQRLEIQRILISDWLRFQPLLFFEAPQEEKASIQLPSPKPQNSATKPFKTKWTNPLSMDNAIESTDLHKPSQTNKKFQKVRTRKSLNEVSITATMSRPETSHSDATLVEGASQPVMV